MLSHFIKFFVPCNHKWEIVTEEETEAPVEKASKSDLQVENQNFPPWFFESKYITILKCEKCGKIDKTVEKNV